MLMKQNRDQGTKVNISEERKQDRAQFVAEQVDFRNLCLSILCA